MTTPIEEAVIETDRLRLRPMRESDAQRVQQFASEREVAVRTGGIPHPYPEGEARRWIGSQPTLRAEEKAEVYAIAERGSDLLVGAIDLRRTDFIHIYEVGFWMARERWGEGICTEALIALVDFAFHRDAYLMRIFAYSFPENPASGRVQEKAGFRQEGLLRQGLSRLAEPRDAVLYAVVREDWEGRL